LSKEVQVCGREVLYFFRVTESLQNLLFLGDQDLRKLRQLQLTQNPFEFGIPRSPKISKAVLTSILFA
jgi:hypothetical protein